MLIHTRKEGECSIIETTLGTIEVKVVRIDGMRVKIGLQAPIGIPFERSGIKKEVLQKIQKKQACIPTVDVSQWDRYQEERRKALDKVEAIS